MPEPEPYQENPHHVPSSTDIVAQLDTSGLGGHDELTDVSPVFRRSAEPPDASTTDLAGEDADAMVTPAPERAEVAKTESTAGSYDPRDHSVREVQEYLDSADEAERERVLAVEQAAAGRQGVLRHKPAD